MAKTWPEHLGALTIVTVAFLLSACQREDDVFVASGLCEMMDTISILESAGQSQGISVIEGSAGAGWTDDYVDLKKEFKVTVSNGTYGQLVSQFRDEVEQVIEDTGAFIHGRGHAGQPGDLSDFSFDYEYENAAGIIRALSVETFDGDLEINLICYEHRK